MLQKRRDLGTMPDGLMKASVELTKGMIVQRKLVDGEYVIALPEEGKPVYGFVTLRDDEAVYKLSSYDQIEKGKRAVVYTLVKDNEWATDQFEGELKIGDLVAAGTNGKLVAAGDSNAIMEVIGVSKAMAGYEFPMVTVKVL